MNYFFTLLRFKLKLTLKSAAFLATALFFLLFSVTLAAILPRGNQSGMKVGILPITEIGNETLRILEENEDYQMVRYEIEDIETMKHDIMLGKLHCGYTISDEWAQTDSPMTLYATKEAYMTPLLDQIVTGAYYEAKMPHMVTDYLRDHGQGSADITDELKIVGDESKPLTIELRAIGSAVNFEAMSENSVQPLIYAVLVCAFQAASILTAMLEEPRLSKAQYQLAVLSHRRFSTITVSVFANIILNMVLLILSDMLIVTFAGESIYAITSRMTMFTILALATAIITIVISTMKRFAVAVISLLPPFLLIGVLCSGALVSPEGLPMGLSLLRFFSPAWYALQIMG